ncbi:uncharacterized protein NPIL_473611 [Nephila pilipes]|uniref:Uncharacterized protein n=1 Tax=Nephila pilipes TaxID=299642 RepID=A0A8X6N1I8_NEPPI|nr:uncharacterized protein NPIL_473611 [Nephila pilipes]
MRGSRRYGAAPLEFGEDLCEEAGLAIDPQHLATEQVDNEQTPVPEFVLGVLHQEGFEGVRDLIAHVRVAQIEAGEDHCLEFALGLDVLCDGFAHQHIQEDDVGRVDESDVLPSLHQEAAVHSPKPHHGVCRVEVAESSASSPKKFAQAPQEFRGGCLNDRFAVRTGPGWPLTGRVGKGLGPHGSMVGGANQVVGGEEGRLGRQRGRLLGLVLEQQVVVVAHHHVQLARPEAGQ